MIHNYTLTFRRTKLIPLSEQDSQKYRIIRNKDVNRFKFIFSDIITIEDQKKWYAKYTCLPNDYMFAIYNNDNQFIGGNALYNINLNEQVGEYGRLLIDKEKCADKYWGYEATIAALNIAFHMLHLKKIYLYVYLTNIPAYKTYLRAGFIDKENDLKASEMTMRYMEISCDKFNSEIFNSL